MGQEVAPSAGWSRLHIERREIPLEVEAALPHNLGRSLLLENLLNDLAMLAQLLTSELGAGTILNAYLLAAGMDQIVDDYLHRDPYSLLRIARRLSVKLWALGAKTAEVTGILLSDARWFSPSNRAIRSWRDELARLTARLADVVAEGGETDRRELIEIAQRLRRGLEGLPVELRYEVLRLPSCFRAFDQRPADVERLVRKFAERWPDRNAALILVGIRTSGSYLLPLYRSYFRMLGYTAVEPLTWRPSRPRLIQKERATVTRGVERGGVFLLIDDPPRTGGSLAKAASFLQDQGVRGCSILLLLQLFGGRAGLPPSLRRYDGAFLEWSDWSIHEELSPAGIEAALRDLAPGLCATVLERAPFADRAEERGHVQARYRARFADGTEQTIVVKGVGLGYFGEHALAVGRKLSAYVPQQYGLRNGLLYQVALDDERRLTAAGRGDEERLSTRIAEYVIARSRAFAVQRDVSIRLVDRGAAWQRASELLSRSFGRLAPAARRTVLHRAAKRLLRVPCPAVIDASMDPSQWFDSGDDADGLQKVGVDERAFSNHDLACFDPIFDVAQAAVRFGGDSIGDRLREAYERLSGADIDAERWLLYQLVHLFELQRERGADPAVERALSRTQQRYFARTLFGDVSPPVTGRFCAVDIDGVLETGWLGFTSATPLGALALRTLTRHGYRVLLASGRSISEVRDRCEAYRLSGGVAAYGSATYDHATGRVRSLVSNEDEAALERLRKTLAAVPSVRIDEAYSYIVRARQYAASGRAGPLAEDVVAQALELAGRNTVRAIPGAGQTDFVASSIDKGVGLLALMKELGPESTVARSPLALAVGDTHSDIPMLALADLAFAPANGDRAVREWGAKMSSSPYQRGLAAAVEALVSHAPGACALCRGPRLSAEGRILMEALAAQDARGWKKTTCIASLAFALARA